MICIFTAPSQQFYDIQLGAYAFYEMSGKHTYTLDGIPPLRVCVCVPRAICLAFDTHGENAQKGQAHADRVRAPYTIMTVLSCRCVRQLRRTMAERFGVRVPTCAHVQLY